jgi:hypothetical protein
MCFCGKREIREMKRKRDREEKKEKIKRREKSFLRNSLVVWWCWSQASE